MFADVLRVRCFDEQEPKVTDGAGRNYSDEVFVVMQNAAGQTVTSPTIGTIDKGDGWHTINMSPHTFRSDGGFVNVSLYEDDGVYGFSTDDDLIGSFSLNASHLNHPTNTITLTGSFAQYEVNFDVFW